MFYETHTLPNGIRLLHVLAASPVVYCGFVVDAGTRQQSPRVGGQRKISFEQAKEFAENEYKKYKERTLSPAEEDYIETIKALSAQAKTAQAQSANNRQEPTSKQ